MSKPNPAREVVERARFYLGQHEEPLGSNDGRFVRGCFKWTWLKFSAIPKGKAYWCAAFVCRVLGELFGRLPWPSASAHDLYDHAKAAGCAIKIPVPGCVADWNIGSGHTSIVIEVDLKGKRVHTIGGNESDKVAEAWRPISEARGFWLHPALIGTAPAKAKKPKAETLTSASGATSVGYSSRLRQILAKTGIGNFTQPANQDRPLPRKPQPPKPYQTPQDQAGDQSRPRQ